MTDHLMEAGSTSHITSNRRVPIVNIATNQPIGYVSSEYVNTRARIGLVFLHGDKAWKILHIAEEETIFVLQDKNLGDLIQSNDPRLNFENHKNRLEKTSTNSFHGMPTTTDELIVLESFQNYIIIHTFLGLPINTTLRVVFDALLTEQDLIRDTYNDASRILIRTSAKLTRDEVESMGVDLFHLAPHEFDRFLLEAISARFPYVVPNEDRPQKESRVAKRLKEELKVKLAVGQSKAIFRLLTEGRIKTLIHCSTFRPSPLAREIIDKYVAIDAAASDTLVKGNAAGLKRFIEKETVELVCLKCLSSQTSMRISQIGERPKCENCGSSLLGLSIIPAQTLRSLFQKKKSKKLSQAETEQLAGTRRTADLVLSYGRRAIITLSVTGIGPQTASSILASMPTNDSEFYSDILRARIHYLTTRELWDRKQRRMTSF